MAGGFLHVTEGDAGVEGGGDEGVSEGVRPDPLVDAVLAGEAAHDVPGGVAVEAFPFRPTKIALSSRSAMARSIARATLGARGMVTILHPLRGTVTVRWPRSIPSASMSGAERFGRA
ncbi:MAG: hypothetical protein M3Q48_03105 [Actinomycetota bacterium]|jgi:hypothetical protein|nr:hypothetical protein [Actinomycetota bacterium]